MSKTMLYVIAFLYFITAFGYYRQGRLGLGLTFICYALANIGLAAES